MVDSVNESAVLNPAEMVLGVAACAGEFPRLVMEGARRAGVKRIVAVGLRGAVRASEIRPLADEYAEFRVGAIEGPVAFAKKHGVTHLILAGQIKPSGIYTMWPDATARRLLAQLDRRNAHTIFGTVCDFMAQNGITVLPSTTFMEHCMAGEGLLAGPEPTPEQADAARFGMQMAQQIARLDIGQSIVVQGRSVVCVEAYKGTNECIQSGGHRGAPVTLCKVTKPGHDMRFDVPCIGPTTIRHCLNAGVNHIAFEAERTILFGREEVLRLCAQHGITLQALHLPPAQETQAPAPVADDAAHAAAMAAEIERLGIGHAAVVCDGVVIAVDDADGVQKCIRRAARYMKRLRFARVVNRLCRLLLGSKETPLAPMVLAATPNHPLTAAERAAARKAGMQA